MESRDKAFCGRLLRCRQPDGDRWCDDNVQDVVGLWQLSKEEEKRLGELKRKLADVNHFKNDPHILVRFMHSPCGPDGAEAAFRRMVQWRRDNQVDNILDDYVPPQTLLDTVPSAILRDFDNEGDPIYVERGGAVDLGALLKLFSREDIMRFAYWTRERNTDGIWINEYERRRGRKVKDITIIYDLKGLSSRHMNPKGLDFFRDIMKLTQAYYPGPIKRMIIIRAPRIFQLIWNVARHFFPPQARAKMIFANTSNYLEILDRYMDRHVLPQCIYEYGSGNVAVGMMQSLDGLQQIDLENRDKCTATCSLAGTEDEEQSLSSENSKSPAVTVGITSSVIFGGMHDKHGKLTVSKMLGYSDDECSGNHTD